jgi:hypothetical protein
LDFNSAACFPRREVAAKLLQHGALVVRHQNTAIGGAVQEVRIAEAIEQFTLRFFASRARIPDLKRSRWRDSAARAGLLRYWLFQFPAEKLDGLLLASLYFEQDRLGHSSVILA